MDEVDVLSFDGTYNSQYFYNWLRDMDFLFYWYEKSEAYMLHFAKIKQQGSAKVY